MRSILVFITFLMISVNSAFALTMKELAGKYKVYLPETPLEYEIKLTAQGKMTLTQFTFEETITCKGNAILDKKILSASLLCKNGMTVEEKIDLTDVKSLNKFDAKVTSSVLPEEMIFVFERL